MRRSHGIRSPQLLPLATLASAAALVFVLPAAASPIEHAVDVTGAAGFVRLKYGDHTVNAGLPSSLEVDGYIFAGKAGDKIRIAFHTLTGGLDAAAELLGPTGTSLSFVSCSGKDFVNRSILCSNALDATLPGNGTYTLNFSDINADNAGNYQLHLDRYPATNNWVGLAYGTANEVTGELGHTTDWDNFAFSAVAGTSIRLTVRTTTGGLDPLMEVLGPAANLVSSTSCSGNDFVNRPILCTNTIDLNVASTGVYTVGLSDVGWDESGGYKLSISCRFGDCPVAAPSPIPEPAQWALLVAGLSGLAGVARRKTTPQA